MKKNILLLSVCAAFVSAVLISPGAYSQCTGGVAGPTITPTAVWTSTSTNPVSGGTYYPFVATAGNTYYFSLCVADGGNTTFDTQLTLLDNTGTPVAGGYSDDDCDGTASTVTWTCPASGTYRILPSAYFCDPAVYSIGVMVYKRDAPLTCPGNLGTGYVTVASLPYSYGPGTTCGMVNDLTSANTLGCGNPLYLGGEDMVFKFTPATTGDVTISLTTAGTNTGLMLYNGCPLNGQGGTCAGSSFVASGNNTLTVCLQGGVTYYLILDSYPNPTPTCNAFSDLTISAPVVVVGCTPPGGVVSIGNLSVTYNSVGRTTCGKGNDQTAANAVTCGSNLYMSGEDELFSFTPNSNGDVNISITSAGSYTGLMLYQGCPMNVTCTGTPGTCLAFEQSSTGDKSICWTVTAGVTYYILVDSWTTPCNSYSITVTKPSVAAGGSLCSNAVAVPSLPFSRLSESTACLGNDYTNASTGSCGTLYESGEDKVYTYTAVGPTCLGVTLTGTSTTSIGYQIYKGCPGVAGTTCIGSNGGATSGTLAGSATLPSAGTYYIIVDEWAPPTNASYDISIVSAGPANDLPCNAGILPLGVNVSGNNSCAGIIDEPGTAPACAGFGVLNTVWYRFIAPASGCVKIRTTLGSINGTRIAAYTSGAAPVACGSGNTLTYINCNANAPDCGFNTYKNSELSLSGLIAGNYYYIMVDGVNASTGSFSVLAIDAGGTCTNTFPPIPGQDCALPLPVCQNVISVANPGYQGIGNVCDFGAPAGCFGGGCGGPGATTCGGVNCLCSGERGATWYKVTIAAAGLLQFDIVPNDWSGCTGFCETDYDFAVFGPNPTCGNLADPIRCHYSALGITGLFSAANGNSPYAGYGSAYRAGISASAGQTYLIVVSNYTNSNAGFTLNFSNTPAGVINTTPAPGGTLIWTGNVNTDWFNINNWGGCAIPTCDLNATIPGFPVNQPVINGAGAICRTLDIGAGASLTINAGNQLQVCQDFTNGGIFTAGTSTVLFQNTTNNNVNQAINGSVTGTNKFYNVTVSKPAGFGVTTNQDVDMAGNFLVRGAAGFGGNFNAANKYHKVSGNFTVESAPLVATYTPATVLEFNGTAQTYFNRGLLESVVMNQTGAGTVTLQNHGLSGTAWMRIGGAASNGTLTLTNGRIIAGFTHGPPPADNRVEVINRAAAPAVSIGNLNSYVQGALRRYLLNPGLGSYNFPVGSAAKGYELINFNRTANVSADYWDVYFDDATTPASPTFAMECGSSYHNALTALNQGIWRVLSSPASLAAGTMTVTNYNRSWSNTLGAGWTVQYNKSVNNSVANWLLNPFPQVPCLAPPVSAVPRNNMSVATVFGSGNEVWFATAQSATPLPVELLRFEAKTNATSIITSWATASETNNKGFELERSSDGYDFEPLSWIDGHGSTSQLNSYSYEDSKVKQGIRYYYRLKQIDFNGDFVYSKVISAQLPKGKNNLYTLMPNPYNNNTTLTLFLDQATEITIDVIDVMGRQIATVAKGQYNSGAHEFVFSAKALGYTSGLYTMRIKIDGQVFIEHLVETD